MKSSARLVLGGMSFAIIIVLVATFSVPASAQGSQGQNAVYNSSSGTVGSSAFIDASMFAQTGTDFCGVLKVILSSTSYPGAGAVIDARSLPGTTGTSMTCAASPWSGISSPPPSTILLPATTGTTPNPVVISSPWVLPSNTHLVGEGDGLFGTTIQVASGSSLATMIQFGSSSFCGSGACSGISVEDLTLDGQAQSIDGILNQYARTNSYVDHVRIYQILGTGLLVSGASATNSGPYSSIKTKATPVKGPVSPR